MYLLFSIQLHSLVLNLALFEVDTGEVLAWAQFCCSSHIDGACRRRNLCATFRSLNFAVEGLDKGGTGGIIHLNFFNLTILNFAFEKMVARLYASVEPASSSSVCAPRTLFLHRYEHGPEHRPPPASG
jgi:hypothetical protein